ncbi:MAG: carboxypeptidase-like regulatory domain-containing protein [Ferruginibacter sp.]
MKKLVYLLLFLFFVCTQLQAQNKSRVITGKVTDDIGNAVSNASVIIKGTSAGTITNSDGMYSLTLPSNARTLVISSVNMEPQEITIGSQSEINATLQAEDNTLSEVVVIGYGTQRRRDVTGSIYKLKDSTLKNIPLQGPDQALRGRVPGVTVTQSSGTPGSGINVLIRGIGSLTANTQPLYVIDGVILQTVQTGTFSQLSWVVRS